METLTKTEIKTNVITINNEDNDLNPLEINLGELVNDSISYREFSGVHDFYPEEFYSSKAYSFESKLTVTEYWNHDEPKDDIEISIDWIKATDINGKTYLLDGDNFEKAYELIENAITTI